MGAEWFDTASGGADVAEAFHTAVEAAYYDYGHAGYTGTIAEKDGYVLAKGKPDEMTAEQYAALVYEIANTGDLPGYVSEATPAQREDGQIARDKWGPALAIPNGPRDWLFVGYASS